MMEWSLICFVLFSCYCFLSDSDPTPTWLDLPLVQWFDDLRQSDPVTCSSSPVTLTTINRHVPINPPPSSYLIFLAHL